MALQPGRPHNQAMTYYVRHQRDGVITQLAVKTAKEAATLGAACLEYGPVKVETPAGLDMDLDQFQKLVVDAVRFPDA